jgi:pimeloyl-ACP methyl ester carboxylesterase
MKADLTGSSTPVAVGNSGFSVRAPGFVGIAEALPAASNVARAGGHSVAAVDATTSAMFRAGMTVTGELQLELQPSGQASSAAARSAFLPSVSVEVPAPQDDEGQVVLVVGEAGDMRWIFPSERPATGTSRGAFNTMEYEVPIAATPPASSGGQGVARNVLGLIAKPLLRVVVYPLTDPIAGAVSEFFVGRWEAENRPHRLRSFGLEDFKLDTPKVLDSTELAQVLSAGRTLLMVHGTFSTTHAAFGDMPSELVAELHRRYEGRVVAFDHPTLSASPIANVEWLMQRLPASNFEFDIVCHSRGGLVSRLLAERLASTSGRVRKLVLAGVPNAGTALADAEHMTQMLDRVTTLLNLLPGNAAADVMEAVLAVVKVAGRGLLHGLHGLNAMSPTSDFLQTLNSAGTANCECFGIASDYEPKLDGLRALVMIAADEAVDRIFGNAGNDLVVPTVGVYSGALGRNFPIPSERLLLLDSADAVTHTQFFAQPAVTGRLMDWLN